VPLGAWIGLSQRYEARTIGRCEKPLRPAFPCTRPFRHGCSCRHCQGFYKKVIDRRRETGGYERDRHQLPRQAFGPTLILLHERAVLRREL
jgi:hypothetical protein